MAPVTGVTLYVLRLESQTVLFPEIGPGIAGAVVLTETESVCAAELPQLLFAVTLIVPPDAPAVVLMLLVEDDPLQPAGNVQV